MSTLAPGLRGQLAARRDRFLSSLQPPAREVDRDGYVVRLDGIQHRYGKRVSLDGITFAIRPGELLFVVGHSGAGKSTLLRILHGDLVPGAGSGHVAGVPLYGAPATGRSVRASVAMVFQDELLLERRTALENVAFALQVRDLWLPFAEVVERSQRRLMEVGLGDRLDAFPQELSGGERQRLAIARALVTGPALLLADEPTASLDEGNAAVVLNLLERVAAAGTAVIAVTHSVHHVRERDARVVALRLGHQVADSHSRREDWLSM